MGGDRDDEGKHRVKEGPARDMVYDKLCSPSEKLSDFLSKQEVRYSTIHGAPWEIYRGAFRALPYPEFTPVGVLRLIGPGETNADDEISNVVNVSGPAIFSHLNNITLP